MYGAPAKAGLTCGASPRTRPRPGFRNSSPSGPCEPLPWPPDSPSCGLPALLTRVVVKWRSGCPLPGQEGLQRSPVLGEHRRHPHRGLCRLVRPWLVQHTWNAERPYGARRRAHRPFSRQRAHRDERQAVRRCRAFFCGGGHLHGRQRADRSADPVAISPPTQTPNTKPRAKRTRRLASRGGAEIETHCCQARITVPKTR